MKPEEFEQELREKRLIEANKKGLMGHGGKIGIVLKYLGDPIISQTEGGGLLDVNYMDLEGRNDYETSIYDLTNPADFLEKIPTMYIEGNSRPKSSEWNQNVKQPIPHGMYFLGMHFDGLSRGIHLEIKYDEQDSELYLTYKGYVVYKETKGELLCYKPDSEWENHIERLFKVAKEKQRKKNEKEFQESIKITEKEKKNWIDKLKEMWGNI